jgi:hypothetical protein
VLMWRSYFVLFFYKRGCNGCSFFASFLVTIVYSTVVFICMAALDLVYALYCCALVNLVGLLVTGKDNYLFLLFSLLVCWCEALF